MRFDFFWELLVTSPPSSCGPGHHVCARAKHRWYQHLNHLFPTALEGSLGQPRRNSHLHYHPPRPNRLAGRGCPPEPQSPGPHHGRERGNLSLPPGRMLLLHKPVWSRPGCSKETSRKSICVPPKLQFLDPVAGAGTLAAFLVNFLPGTHFLYPRTAHVRALSS